MQTRSFRKIVSLWVGLSFFSVQAQVSSETLERESVEIKARSEVNDSLYKKIKDQKAILVGEVHGTKEHPEFFMGIVRTLLKNGKKVLAAVELPSDGIDLSQPLDTQSMKQSYAFNTHTLDGRQCVAWAEMLVELQKTKATIVCFDLARTQKGDNRAHRDSLMFVNINEALKKDTAQVLVVLSGNLSTRLVPNKNAKTMGLYLRDGNESVLKGKPMLSLICMYNGGQSYNWVNNGYKLHETEGNAGFYGYAAVYDNYFMIYPVLEGYNGVLFSSTISASGPLHHKK